MRISLTDPDLMTPTLRNDYGRAYEHAAIRFGGTTGVVFSLKDPEGGQPLR
jgi:hypothetical protein